MDWGASAVLDPAGPQAARLAQLFWIFFWVLVLVYAAVTVALIAALTRKATPPDPRRRTRVVLAAGALTTAVLIALLVVSVDAGRGLNPLPGAHGPVVKVTGHQWWWEFQYEASPPSDMVTTANELHIPTRTPVLLRLTSADVIHSFWVPALYGKRDLIPGHDSTTYIQADRPGLFRGRCAEFCGDQHANMGFFVLAEPPEAFQRWLARQRQPAAAPASPLARRGEQVFLGGPCPLCHTVLGTVAGARMGPDLTHIASRISLGAGTRPNTRGHLAGWLLDAQGIKPGSHMPPLPLAGEELEALLAYLAGLD